MDGPLAVSASGLQIRRFEPQDEAAVITLWTQCGLTRPWNDPQRDIARKRAEQPELFLVGTVEGEVVASAMVGYEGHRGWVYYLAVAPSQQRRRHGEALMRKAESLLIERGCPKINLQIRSSNVAVIAFYEQLGYSQYGVVSLGKRLIADGPPSC